MTGDWPRFVPDADGLGLATDLYQLTMGAAYHRNLPGERGSFELTVRGLPARRSFLLFAGLEPALAALGELRFPETAVAWLRSLDVFSGVEDSYFDRLASFTFRGDVWALPEGTVFFPGEPVMRVSGDLLEAQLVETLLLSIVNSQTAIASKAARMRLAAGDAVQLSEFGTRRAHGPQAGMWAARAAWLAGFESTSNVLAGRRFGIPVVGTMAHSYVMAADSEERAFADYQATFPEHSIFLIDTYDTLEGLDKALALEVPFKGVRLDSGDLLELSKRVRSRLDEAGRAEVLVFASGDVDEWVIEELRRAGAPIDAYGVGSKLSTAADAPFLGGVYKLVGTGAEGAERPTLKRSAGKTTWPGRKQLLRRSRDGVLVEDRIVLEGAVPASDETPLLRQVMSEGRPVEGATLAEARRQARDALAALPSELRALETPAEPYPVHVDRAIVELAERA